METRVAIVEDDAGVCEELRLLVEREQGLVCVCVCRSSESALRMIPSASPDVLLMDIELSDGSGIDCIARLRPSLPETQILMFTVHDDTDHIVKALKAGASGYLLKDSPPDEISAAIRAICDRGAPMSREVARTLVDSFHPSGPAPATEPLTMRETEILRLLSEDMLNKEISERLQITMNTLGWHMKNIYRKLDVRSRTAAVMKYCR